MTNVVLREGRNMLSRVTRHVGWLLLAVVVAYQALALTHSGFSAPLAGGALRAGVKAMGLEMFPDPSIASNTVAAIKSPKGVEPAAVVQAMRERYGVLIGTGLDKLRTSTLRIGTMGITASTQYILPALSALELALRDLGHKAESGAGVAAAQAAFADGI